MNSLSTNVEKVNAKKEAWEDYKLLNCKYDDSVSYWEEVVKQEVISDRQKNKPPLGEDYIHNWLYNSLEHYYTVGKKDDEWIKKHYYNWWVDNQYPAFSKNYNPDTVQDAGLNFMFVTFNFKDDTDVNVMKMDMARIFNLPVFKMTTITYTYEHCSSQGHHPHVHALIELNHTGTISPSTMLEKIFQQKKLREYLAVHYLLSWANKKDKKCRKRAVCLAYVSGHKAERKLEHVEGDKIWRAENGFEESYVKINK